MTLEQWIDHHLANAPAADQLPMELIAGSDFATDAAILLTPARDAAA